MHRAVQQRMHTTEMKMLRWIQSKSNKNPNQKRKFLEKCNGQVNDRTYATQNRRTWYDHVLRRDERDVAKEIKTMEMGRIKGALYRIWCGVNRLGDNGVKVV